MPLKYRCFPDNNLLQIDNKHSFVSFTLREEGLSPGTVQVRWRLMSGEGGAIPVDDAQLRVVACLNGKSDGEQPLRAAVEFPPYEQRVLGDLAREAFGAGVFRELQLTLGVEAPGYDSCRRARSRFPVVLRVNWSSTADKIEETATFQLVWTLATVRKERRVLAFGLDLGTSSDSVATIVDVEPGVRPLVMYLLEEGVGDNIGRLVFVPEKDVGPRYRNTDSDIVAVRRWKPFADRRMAVTAPEHNLRVMAEARGGESTTDLVRLARLKACMAFFKKDQMLEGRWPYSGLSVMNLINRVRHAALQAPCVIWPGVQTFLTFSFSFCYDAVCDLAHGVKTYCDSAVPAITIPEGQATGLAFLGRAIREHGESTLPGEKQVDAVRKCLCKAFGLQAKQHVRMDKVLIVAHDVGDGTAEACLQVVETCDDPEARRDNVADRALISSRASLYWAEPLGGGGRITVLIRSLFVLRLILRLFDRCESGQDFFRRLDELMRGFGLGAGQQHRPGLPVPPRDIVDVWPLALALAERTLAGDPEVEFALAPDVAYFRLLAERRFRYVRYEDRQFVTYALHMPDDVKSVRRFVERFRDESVLDGEKPPAYLARAREMLSSDDEKARQAMGQARGLLKWMVNCLFDFHPDPNDTVEERRFRERFGQALWEIAEQYKCQFPMPKRLEDHGKAGEAVGGEVSPEDAIRDPEWRYESLASRSPMTPRIPLEKEYLFENLWNEFGRSGSPGEVLLRVLGDADLSRPFDFHNSCGRLVELLAVPPLVLFRHTVVPTYVMLHNAFGLFYQAGDLSQEHMPKFFIPSGRGTAFAVYQYLLKTYVLGHYGAEFLAQLAGREAVRDPGRLGAVPIIKSFAEDPIGLKHCQVDGALCKILLEKVAPIAVRIEHDTAAAPYFPYEVRIIEKGAQDAAAREEVLLSPGPWQAPASREYANREKRFQAAGGGLRFVRLEAGYGAGTKIPTSMRFQTPLRIETGGTNLVFTAVGRRETPVYKGEPPPGPEKELIGRAYRDLVPPAISVRCESPRGSQTFDYRVHETIELPNIFMEHETALLP